MELSVRRCIYPASHLAVGGNWQPARYLVCVCFYLTGKVARCRVTLNFLLCHSSVPLRNLNVPVHLLLSPSHCTPHVFLIRTWDGRQRHILSWPAPNSCFLCFFFICKLGSYVLFLSSFCFAHYYQKALELCTGRHDGTPAQSVVYTDQKEMLNALKVLCYTPLSHIFFLLQS